MAETQRDLLNVRIIGTTFRVAAETHPEHVGAVIRKARSLLTEARAGATTDDLRDAIAAVEAEVDAVGHREGRRQAG